MISAQTGKIAVLIGLVAVVSLFHYLTPLYQVTHHLFLSRFYYLPIILGSTWFGLRGGLLTSLSVTLIYLPHVFLHWKEDPTVFWDRLLEIFLFNLAGIMVGILVDKERRQRQQTHELQTLAALGEAAASLAHEMKNIIIPIRGFLQRIQSVTPRGEKAYNYLEIVEKETGRLEHMTKEMLSYSRQAPVQKTEIEVCTLVGEMQETLAELFKPKGVSLSVACPEGGVQGFLDYEKIRQVLINLLENALDASRRGNAVELMVRRNGQEVTIEIRDHGDGIPPEDLDRIFIPFFTTKPKGTGLGLAVSRRIVEEHGGKLSVQSVQGQGTVFTLKLPVA